MRFHDPLEQILRGRSSLRVTKTLLRHPRKGFTGRELAREADVHPSDAATALRTLAAQGVVRRRTVGRAHEWRLNPEHFLVKPLSALIAAETEGLPHLHALVARHLGGRPGVVRAVLFGSLARGEEEASSDIDLLVVVRSDQDKVPVEPALRSLREAIEATFTNPLSEVIYSVAEYNAKRHLPLVQSIEEEGVIVVDETHAQEGDAAARGENLPIQGGGVPPRKPGGQSAK